jgi:hypothetical protein
MVVLRRGPHTPAHPGALHQVRLDLLSGIQPDLRALIQPGMTLQLIEPRQRRIVDRIDLAEHRRLAVRAHGRKRAEVEQLEAGLSAHLRDEAGRGEQMVIDLALQESAVDEHQVLLAPAHAASPKAAWCSTLWSKPRR